MTSTQLEKHIFVLRAGGELIHYPLLTYMGFCCEHGLHIGTYTWLTAVIWFTGTLVNATDACYARNVVLIYALVVAHPTSKQITTPTQAVQLMHGKSISEKLLLKGIANAPTL